MIHVNVGAKNTHTAPQSTGEDAESTLDTDFDDIDERAGSEKRPKQSWDFLNLDSQKLTLEQVQHPIVQHFLIEDLRKKEEEVSELKLVEKEYHKVDKELAVLRNEKSISLWNEILHLLSTIVGAALLGGGFQDQKWEFMVPGGILIIIGIVARAVRK